MIELTPDQLETFVKVKAYELQQVLGEVPPDLIGHIFQRWQLMAKQARFTDVIDDPSLVVVVPEPEPVPEHEKVEESSPEDQTDKP